MPAGLPVGAAWPGSPVPAPPLPSASATARRCSPATSQPSSPNAASLLPPFPLWPALPTSEYYGGSAPSQGPQPTAGLPATGPAGRWEGQPREGSHVSHVPVDGGGAQLFPGSLATPTPQTFSVASSPARFAGLGVALRGVHACVRCCPAHIRQVRGRFWPYGGLTTGSALLTPSRLACRTQAIWQSWPVPSLSGLLPPSPAPPGSGCPQLQRPAATGRRRSPFTSARTRGTSWRTIGFQYWPVASITTWVTPSACSQSARVSKLEVNVG